MSRYRDLAAALTLTAAAAVAWAQAAKPLPPGIGRVATPAEVQAWDIDVRPDFKGLPKGSGSVDRGMEIWEGKCASCHGVFGESNEVFMPIVGGTTADDIRSGRVKGLVEGAGGARTTLSKISTLSTMWDYIHRAMPWTEPKSLAPDDVYAVVAYILHLGDVVPAGFVLSDANIREVQQRLPNRYGKTTEHGMWLPSGKPDVQGVVCMTNCSVNDARVASYLPDAARNVHGNLLEQNRPVGPVRGVDTTRPVAAAGVATVAAAAPSPAPAAPPRAASALDLAKAQGCTACHGVANKVVGPGFAEIAGKHKARADIEDYLTGKIKAGGSGVWGAIPMPAQAQLKDDDARLLARWIVQGAR